ncbi:outer membrane protein assembly factor BamB family protein [Halorussus ruber]|uniref:outer membrane protein assembly factor BamB family protein n=1 Tax=Halorussus ruber TaxID=1126238 RepID=UPI001092AD6B|nr:PQQ-binding-like beta-propeller repeat protein [Halorussus ruber]
MAEVRTRRAFLSLVGAAATAGCSGIPSFASQPPPVAADPETDWVQAGRDAGHAAYVPSAEGAPSEVRWEFGPHEHVSRPVVVGESAYVVAEVPERGLFGHRKSDTKVVLFRIDPADGTARRVAATEDRLDGWGTDDFSFHRGRFYLADYGSLFALDARTGREAWRRDGVSTTARPAAADGLVVLGCYDGVCCFDAETGDRRWRNPIPPRRAVLDSPAIADGRVVYVVNDGDTTEPPQSATVRAVEAETGEAVWSMETDAVSFGGPVVAGDTAYLANEKYVYALDAATGARRWRTPISPPDYLLGTDLCVGPERVFVSENPDDSSGLTALSRADGEREWTLDTRDVCYRATRTSDALYVCVSGERNRHVAEDFHAALLSVNPGSGEPYWKYRLRHYAAEPPVAAGGSLYVTRGLQSGMSLLAFGY